MPNITWPAARSALGCFKFAPGLQPTVIVLRALTNLLGTPGFDVKRSDRVGEKRSEEPLSPVLSHFETKIYSILGRFAFGKTRRGPRCARQARQRLASPVNVICSLSSHNIMIKGIEAQASRMLLVKPAKLHFISLAMRAP